MADEEDDITDGGYKSFVIESSAKKQSSNLEFANGETNIADEEPRQGNSQHDMPPAAVQRVSFGMLPNEIMQNKLTPIQRASLLNEMELQR